MNLFTKTLELDELEYPLLGSELQRLPKQPAIDVLLEGLDDWIPLELHDTNLAHRRAQRRGFVRIASGPGQVPVRGKGRPGP